MDCICFCTAEAEFPNVLVCFTDNKSVGVQVVKFRVLEMQQNAVKCHVFVLHSCCRRGRNQRADGSEPRGPATQLN